MSEPERLAEVDRWLSYADEDLRTAEVLAGQGVPRQVCFHAQQAAEKAIKAVFVFLQTEFPYTHDLDRLRGLLSQGWTVKEDPPDLSGLTFWAMRGRYPGSPREATVDEASVATEQARRVYKRTLEDLKRHGSGQKTRRDPRRTIDLPQKEAHRGGAAAGRDQRRVGPSSLPGFRGSCKL